MLNVSFLASFHLKETSSGFSCTLLSERREKGECYLLSGARSNSDLGVVSLDRAGEDGSLFWEGRAGREPCGGCSGQQEEHASHWESRQDVGAGGQGIQE